MWEVQHAHLAKLHLFESSETSSLQDFLKRSAKNLYSSQFDTPIPSTSYSWCIYNLTCSEILKPYNDAFIEQSTILYPTIPHVFSYIFTDPCRYRSNLNPSEFIAFPSPFASPRQKPSVGQVLTFQPQHHPLPDDLNADDRKLVDVDQNQKARRASFSTIWSLGMDWMDWERFH